MSTRSPAVKGGLEVRKDATGWGVWHAESGLSAAKGLRQRRFADEARAEFLATGADFTRPRKAVVSDSGKWKEVYLRWARRASQTRLDPETFEYYPEHVHAGALVPSAALAAEMRAAGIHVDDAAKWAREHRAPAPDSYEQALAAPTGRGGRGWRHADETSCLAAAAQALQHRHPGLAPRLVFEGAQKQGLTSKQLLALGDDWQALDALMWA